MESLVLPEVSWRPYPGICLFASFLLYLYLLPTIYYLQPSYPLIANSELFQLFQNLLLDLILRPTHLHRISH